MENGTAMSAQERQNRWISVIVFVLCCSWILALPFKGSILSALADFHLVALEDHIFYALAAHLIGLLIAGYSIKSALVAKQTMIGAVAINVALFFVFLLQPSVLWLISLYIGAFLSGVCLASWGFFYKTLTPYNLRLKTAVDLLFFSTILSTFINLLTQYVSPAAAVITLGLFQLVGLGFVKVLPVINSEDFEIGAEEPTPDKSETRRIIFLTVFILLVTLNSGLLHQVVNPRYLELSHVLRWYQALPYLVTLLILRNLPTGYLRSLSVPIILALSGFACIAFSLFNGSAVGYIFIDLLMFTASAIFNLFVWSILSELMVIFKPPSRTMGIGLGANVLGVMLGWLVGMHFLSPYIDDRATMLAALAVTSVTLILLPFFTQRVSELRDEQEVKNLAAEISLKRKDHELRDSIIEDKLSSRENEIAQLLFTGMTNKNIANELYVSENTVKTHVKSIYSKTGVNNRVELMNLFLNEPKMEKSPE